MANKQTLNELLKQFSDQLGIELENIMAYWIANTLDNVNGGFVGRIDENNLPDTMAPKGSVLNARILWSFAATYNLTQKTIYLEQANRAYHYLCDYFIDAIYGGVFWTVDYKGNPLNTKKQTYAIAFVIYGFAEYYKASGIKQVKELAISLYKTLVKRSYDKKHEGYIEAFTRDWNPAADCRLSDKDANAKKTMNTHLHVLEAYTNLYRIWPQNELREQIIMLLDVFLNYIIDHGKGHLTLFFDEKWQPKSNIISFGHDIEAAWLLLEAAEVIQDEYLIQKIKKISIIMAGEAENAIDKDYGMWYEFDPDNNHWIKEKHWWVQAEAMVGFINAWQLTSDTHLLQLSVNIWHFIQYKIYDKKHQEWLWGIYENDKIMTGQDKAGIWKCPYHNSRACIEIINRSNRL